jgi:hypothetical protein
MRKFVVAGVIATLGVALLAIPASASFEHHFSVIGKQISSHDEPNGFRFQDKLFNPHNRSDKVGRDRGECKLRPGVRKLKCHAHIHLNGEIGGFGNIRVRGTLGRHDTRVEVVAGTDDFNGVAGKMLLHHLHGDTDKLHFDLVR